MSKHYKSAIIGCGNISRIHADGYKGEPRCKLVALADIKREAAEKLAAEKGLSPAIYTDYRKMLRREKPDIVSVCLWPALHLQAVRDCVEAGVAAVHCEKPMAPTWGESLELAALAGNGTQLSFNHQRRFTRGLLQAKRLLDEGVFGALERMDLFPFANLLDVGTHLLDIAFMYNNECPVKWVVGQVDAREVRTWFGVPFEFMGVGFIRYENGVRGFIHAGDDKEMGTGLRLVGSKGFIELEWDGACRRAAVYADPGFRVPALEEPDPMPAVMGNIVDCLESGKEPEQRAERALRVAEVIFAIYESSRRRARIDLPLGPKDSAFLSMLKNGEIGPSPSTR